MTDFTIDRKIIDHFPSVPEGAPKPGTGMANRLAEIKVGPGKAPIVAAVTVAAAAQAIHAYNKHEELPENTRIAEAGSEGVAALGGAGAGALLGIKAGASLPLPLPARGIAAFVLGGVGVLGGKELVDSTISWAQSKTAGLFGGSDEVAATPAAHADKAPAAAAAPAAHADKEPAAAAAPAAHADKAPAAAAAPAAHADKAPAAAAAPAAHADKAPAAAAAAHKPKKSSHHSTTAAHNHHEDSHPAHHEKPHKKAEHHSSKGDKFTHYMEALAATNDVKGIKVDGILTDNEKQNIETALDGKLETHKGKIVGMNVGAFVHLDDNTKAAISVSPSKNADEYDFSVDMSKLPHKQNHPQKHAK